ncbi:SCO family protein [Microvirga puerhi]|uniref:SCO family protein n=1 Tax=Microvirga puerhi TaxID=2876078 RepID=A0ABS7VJN9_9HYPH|nr:SCO family protein [Microvirga puerhi]MBZ6075704.1 SCO family protein [Microvirga puerhi]
MRSLFVLFLAVFSLSAAAAPFNAFEVAGIDRRPDAQVPLDVVVRDETGRNISLRALGSGKPIILIPVQHQCPNICGVTLGGIASAVLAQPYKLENDFSLIAFGIDPKETSRESAASLKDLQVRLRELAARGGLHAVTASPETTKAVTDALGYRYAWDEQLGQFAHIAATAVLTEDGRLERWLYGLNPDPLDLRLALTEAGQGRIGGWGEQLLLLCYHYNPQTGQYGALVWLMLRIGGGLTVAILLAFLIRAFMRERRERMS